MKYSKNMNYLSKKNINQQQKYFKTISWCCKTKEYHQQRQKIGNLDLQSIFGSIILNKRKLSDFETKPTYLSFRPYKMSIVTPFSYILCWLVILDYYKRNQYLNKTVVMKQNQGDIGLLYLLDKIKRVNEQEIFQS